MGHEVELQAIPNDWSLFQEAITGERSADYLQCMVSLFNHVREGYSAESWMVDARGMQRSFFEEAMQQVGKNPHLLGLYCNLDRKYDFVIYMLNLMAETEAERDIVRSAVLGSQQLHENAVGGQGFPMNWSTPEQAKTIGEFVVSVDFKEMANRFDISKIKPDDGLYKSHQITHAATASQFLFGYARQLYEFYDAIADSGFAVLMVRD